MPEFLARLLPDGLLPAATAIGGYCWIRSNDVEIDVVGAERQPVAKQLLFLGSVRWLVNPPFDSHDLTALHKCRPARLFLPSGGVRPQRTAQRLV